MSRLENVLWVLAVVAFAGILLVLGVNAYEIHSQGKSIPEALREASLLACVALFHPLPGVLLGALLSGLVCFRLGSRPTRLGAVRGGVLGAIAFTMLGRWAWNQIDSGPDKRDLEALCYGVAMLATLLIFALLLAWGVAAIREARDRAWRDEERSDV